VPASPSSGPAEQARRGLVGLDDAQRVRVQHQHRVVGDLEQQPVARLGLAALPVVAFELMLGLEETLLDRAGGAQVAPERQHRALRAQPHRRPGDRDVQPERRWMVDLAPARAAFGAHLAEQLLDLAPRVAAGGFGPWPPDPGLGRGTEAGLAGGNAAHHAVGIDDERDVTGERDEGARQRGRQPGKGSKVGGL
jgi:hypothetical protein